MLHQLSVPSVRHVHGLFHHPSFVASGSNGAWICDVRTRSRVKMPKGVCSVVWLPNGDELVSESPRPSGLTVWDARRLRGMIKLKANPLQGQESVYVSVATEAKLAVRSYKGPQVRRTRPCVNLYPDSHRFAVELGRLPDHLVGRTVSGFRGRANRPHYPLGSQRWQNDYDAARSWGQVVRCTPRWTFHSRGNTHSSFKHWADP